MTYDEAIKRIIDAAISWWSQHTYERDLREALEVVCAEPAQPKELTERERTLLAAWMTKT